MNKARRKRRTWGRGASFGYAPRACGEAPGDAASLEGPHNVDPVTAAADVLLGLGRAIALAGLILPLLLIGGIKFMQFEIEALKPIISGTPWLAWLYPVFGYAGASYFLGAFELMTAAMLMASPWSARAGVMGGAFAALTFLVTSSIMLALPIWEPTIGFPAIGPTGSFLIKDVTLLGVALLVLADGLVRMRAQNH